MYQFHPIATVTPLPGYQLHATFVSGESRLYDASQLTKISPVFEDLYAIRGLFQQVRLDCGGLGVVWNENLDLSSESIWANGTPTI
jgi:hypothetical protein